MFKKYKFPIIIGITISVLIFLIILLCLSMTKEQEKLNLSHLIETPYEVLTIRKNSSPDPYEIIMTGDLDYTDQVLLSTKIQKEVSNYENLKNRKINLHVYTNSTKSKDIQNTVNIDNPSYRYTIEIDGSNILKYEAINISTVKADVLASTDWQIENSYFNENKELVFSVNLMPDLETETLFSTLKGINEDMIRYNFKNKKEAKTKLSVQLSDSESLYYSSDNENYVIQKLVLIGKGE
ncbi:hypothetical protein [Turicibacter sanguinis]|uniref:hypothetical protein n=1 Tax=Turicibacter sanguinis TaxID=154288 RepID=UPI0018AAD42D|nr:hypothetical protein [Turicibacter sanguinis]MDB8559599.1 hypothetical protein [Turicibacter sanguinis]MDB8561052.1 hypothetical protein [Turicibacter sanguinis]